MLLFCLQVSKEEQPNQQLAEEIKDTPPQSRDVPNASTDGSSTSTGAPPSTNSSSSDTQQSTTDTVQASESNESTIVECEPSSCTPLPAAGDLHSRSAGMANTETKESGGDPVQTGGDSFAADLNCPDVNEKSSENLNRLQSEVKTQVATPVQTDSHSSITGASNSSVSEPKDEDKDQEGIPLQTSLAANVSSSGVSGPSTEGTKSQEAKGDGGNDQIVPS